MQDKPRTALREVIGCTLIASAMVLGGARVAHSALTTPSCLAKKLKAWGKLRGCQALENGKALQSRPADPARCQTKFDDALAKLNAQATAGALACRYGDNGNGTATDYDTGLQWEQKTGSVGFFRRCPEPYCPAGDEFSGTYSATGCSGGSFYIAVSAYGTAWTGTSSGDSVPACNGAFSGTISGTTLTGTGPFGTTISGTIDCSNAAASGTIGGPVTGSWSGTTDYCPDPHDVNDVYAWADGETLGAHSIPDGNAFTQFLARLNDCRSTDGTTLTGGFAGHCDWRLPTEVELLGIVDPGASGCGSGSPCIDQTVFGPTVASTYLSATTLADYPDYVWDVLFASGVGVYEDHKVQDNYVRAVRAGL